MRWRGPQPGRCRKSDGELTGNRRSTKAFNGDWEFNGDVVQPPRPIGSTYYYGCEDASIPFEADGNIFCNVNENNSAIPCGYKIADTNHYCAMSDANGAAREEKDNGGSWYCPAGVSPQTLITNDNFGLLPCTCAVSSIIACFNCSAQEPGNLCVAEDDYNGSALAMSGSGQTCDQILQTHAGTGAWSDCDATNQNGVPLYMYTLLALDVRECCNFKPVKCQVESLYNKDGQIIPFTFGDAYDPYPTYAMYAAVTKAACDKAIAIDSRYHGCSNGATPSQNPDGGIFCDASETLVALDCGLVGETADLYCGRIDSAPDSIVTEDRVGGGSYLCPLSYFASELKASSNWTSIPCMCIPASYLECIVCGASGSGVNGTEVAKPTADSFSAACLVVPASAILLLALN